MSEKRWTIAVDFDGVLNSYVSGWVLPEELPDPPVDGAIEWLNEIVDTYDVVIFTTRAKYPDAIPAIDGWLRKHGFTGKAAITARKPAALVYIDDRAWRFSGRFPTVEQIRWAKPWRSGDPVRPPIREKIEAKNRELKALEDKLGRVKFELRELRAVAEEILDAQDELALAAKLEKLAVLVGRAAVGDPA